MRFRRMMVLVLAFWMVATLIPTSASASEFRIRLEDTSVVTSLGGGYGVVIEDDGAGDFADGQPGAMTILLDPSFGTNPLSTNGVTTTMTLAFSYPAYPQTTDILAELKLQSTTVRASGATTVRIVLEDTGARLGGPDGFATPPSGTLKLQSSMLAGIVPTGATITTQSWIAAVPPSLGALQSNPGELAAMADITLPGGTFLSGVTGDSFATFSSTGPTYSLFTQVLITFGAGGGEVRFDADNRVTEAPKPLEEPTPEPGSLMLIATGVIGLGSRVRRRMFARG